jgi:hypothetical protein
MASTSKTLTAVFTRPAFFNARLPSGDRADHCEHYEPEHDVERRHRAIRQSPDEEEDRDGSDDRVKAPQHPERTVLRSRRGTFSITSESVCQLPFAGVSPVAVVTSAAS